MRSYIRNTLAILALVFGGALCSSASATDLLDTAGSAAKMICPKTEVLFWGKSHHPGGAGSLNEDNRGLGFRCYHETSFWGIKAYGEGDELKNSQRGRATVWGLGAQKELFRFGNLSSDLGVGYVRVGYEVPKYHQTAYRWVWSANMDIAYELSPTLGTITLNALPVPAQGGPTIWLFYAGWRKAW